MDILLLVVSATAVALIASVIFRQGSQHASVRWFLSMCGALIVWVFANYSTNHYHGNDVVVQVANDIAYLSGLLAFYSGTMFTYYFPVKLKNKKRERDTLTAVSAICAILSITPFVSGTVTITEGVISYQSGNLLIVYLMVMVLLLGSALKNLFEAASEGSAKSKAQARIVYTAYLVSGAIGLASNVVLPILGQGWDGTRLAPISIVVFASLVSYSMIRHGLFDIRFAAVRTLAYVLALTTLAVVYFGLAYIVSVIFLPDSSQANATVTPMNIGLALLLAFIFQPVKQLFDKITNRIFFRNRYSSSEFIASFGALLASSNDLKQLLQAASEKIAQTLKSSEVTFVIHRDEDTVEIVGVGNSTKLDASVIKGLSSVARTLDTVTVVSDLIEADKFTTEEQRALRYIKKHSIDILLPIDASIGYALLGEPKGPGYKRRDVVTLDAIRDELFIAIQNARSLEEVRKFNKTLQQRVSTATKELRNSNTQLKKLDETKDEFISMASHQLRTPLTSIKGYVSMLLDGDAGQLNDQQRKLLGEAFVSSERMVRLIGDFLNVSRLQTGKFIIDPVPVDLISMVDEEVEAIKRMADQHQVKLSFKPPKTFPTLMIDENKTRQVIMNFIDNAVYYSRQKSTIVVKLHKDERNVFFEVHDHGIGVPKELQGQLFSKFFRAENARRKRPDGTGVGLYLAKKVIDAQGGEVLFSSTEGKGSMFGFRLPIKQPTAKQ